MCASSVNTLAAATCPLADQPTLPERSRHLSRDDSAASGAEVHEVDEQVEAREMTWARLVQRRVNISKRQLMEAGDV